MNGARLRTQAIENEMRLLGKMEFLYYKLEGHTPVPCKQAGYYQRLQDVDSRRVALTEINSEIQISTVFIGLDVNFGVSPPLLFETRVDGGLYHDYHMLYETWDEAEQGHTEMVAFVRSKIGMEIGEDELGNWI